MIIAVFIAFTRVMQKLKIAMSPYGLYVFFVIGIRHTL